MGRESLSTELLNTVVHLKNVFDSDYFSCYGQGRLAFTLENQNSLIWVLLSHTSDNTVLGYCRISSVSHYKSCSLMLIINFKILKFLII